MNQALGEIYPLDSINYFIFNKRGCLKRAAFFILIASCIKKGNDFVCIWVSCMKLFFMFA